jgi:hypothetical protein
VVELYCDARPETCLGCGGAIVTGDVVVPADRGWLLCLDCGSGLLLGRQLQAWAGQAPNQEWERRAAMNEHPGWRTGKRESRHQARGARPKGVAEE